jgi:hypothetical protein
MQHDIHESFHRLELYFEATVSWYCLLHAMSSFVYLTCSLKKEQDCYKVISYRPPPNQPDKVTFETPDHEKLALPSADLLSLHATCCQVAHLSGSAEYIDKLFEDAERLDVLANDGTSSDLLHYQLLLLSNGVTASSEP